MSVDFGDFTESLLREVNPPGTNVFTSATTADLTGYLSDAFWEASLDGFLTGFTCDADGIVTQVGGGTDEFPRGDTALVILYAGVKMLRNKILNMNTSFKAVAGTVEYEVQQSATMMVEMLKQLQLVKDRLLARHVFPGTLDGYIDALSVRSYDWESYWGSYPGYSGGSGAVSGPSY